MRSKKLVFLAALTVMLVVGLVCTGTALAGTPGPTIHHMHVTGTLVNVVWIDVAAVPDHPGAITWHMNGAWAGTLLGDLQGTFTEPATQHGLGATAADWDGYFSYLGKGTFAGTLPGVPSGFTYKSLGFGYDGFDAGKPANGLNLEIRSTWTITGSTGPYSHLRGIIYFHTFVTLAGGGTTYCGDLFW